MKTKLIYIICFLFAITKTYSDDINYLGIPKTNKVELFVENFVNLLKTKDMGKFIDLLSNEINVRPPLSTASYLLKKKDFIKDFNENSFSDITSISFFYGIIFDDEYSLSEFKKKSFSSDNTIKFTIFKNILGECDFTIIITHKEIDLTSLNIDIINNKIVSIQSYCHFFNDTNVNNYRNLIISKETYLYSDNKLIQKEDNLYRNEEIFIINILDIYYDKKKNYYKNNFDKSYLERKSFVNYIYVPRLEKKGYILDSDYLSLPRKIYLKTEEDLDNWFPNSNQEIKKKYISKVDKLRLTHIQ